VSGRGRKGEEERERSGPREEKRRGSSNLPRCAPRVPRVPSFLPRRSTLQVSTSAPPPEPGHAVGLVRVIIIACTMPFTAIYHRERCPWDPNRSFKSLPPAVPSPRNVSPCHTLTPSPSPPHPSPPLHPIIHYYPTFISPSPSSQLSSRSTPPATTPLFPIPHPHPPPCLARQ
jgi:hypothetical protein